MKKHLRLAVIVAFIFYPVMTQAQSTNSPLTPREFKTEIKRTIELRYLLYLPTDLDVKSNKDSLAVFKKWPLVLFLHGAGERGTNLMLVAKHGPPRLAQLGTNFPFIIVAPQCAAGRVWDASELVA